MARLLRIPSDLSGASAGASDGSLLARLRDGSEDAAVELYRRYAQRLVTVARTGVGGDLAARIDPEDVVQSVFGSFFRGAREGHYAVPSGEDLMRLFLGMTLNKVRARGAFHRAARRAVRATEELGASPEVPARSDPAAAALLKMTIDEAIGKLPAGHGQVVRLRAEGYEVAEIASRLGRAKRTIERLLQEARQYLARVLEGD